APILGDFDVNFAGYLVEDGGRISVCTYRTEDRLPNVVLLTATAMIAQCQLVGINFLRSDKRVAQVVAHRRLEDAFVRAFQVIKVVVLVDVDVGVGVKVDRIGAGGKGAIVVRRIEDLHGQSLPTAG